MSSGFNYENIAKICHEANRAYCETIGDFSQESWEGAPAWQRESAILGVKLHFNNEGSTVSDSHNSWMAQKVSEGWVYGVEKNIEKKEHPCIVPYEELSVLQKRKDYIFKFIVDGYKASL